MTKGPRLETCMRGVFTARVARLPDLATGKLPDSKERTASDYTGEDITFHSEYLPAQ
jgi:hypothetical protein